MPAMSGAYVVVRSSVTTSTAITIQQVTVVAGTMVEYTRCWVNQSTITTSAATRIQFLRKSAVATVTSATPAPLGNGMQASKCVGGSTATGITATGEGTDGVVYVEEGFNIVGNGWLYLPVPEERVYMINTSGALKFPTAPTSAGYVSGMEWLEYAS
jgi:hypothetical protein